MDANTSPCRKQQTTLANAVAVVTTSPSTIRDDTEYPTSSPMSLGVLAIMSSIICMHDTMFMEIKNGNKKCMHIIPSDASKLCYLQWGSLLHMLELFDRLSNTPEGTTTEPMEPSSSQSTTEML